MEISLSIFEYPNYDTPIAHNAQLTGKKLLAKIATKEQKPTVFCPCLIACYVFGIYELYTNK